MLYGLSDFGWIIWKLVTFYRYRSKKYYFVLRVSPLIYSPFITLQCNILYSLMASSFTPLSACLLLFPRHFHLQLESYLLLLFPTLLALLHTCVSICSSSPCKRSSISILIMFIQNLIFSSSRSVTLLQLWQPLLGALSLPSSRHIANYIKVGLLPDRSPASSFEVHAFPWTYSLSNNLFIRTLQDRTEKKELAKTFRTVNVLDTLKPLIRHRTYEYIIQRGLDRCTAEVNDDKRRQLCYRYH